MVIKTNLALDLSFFRLIVKLLSPQFELSVEWKAKDKRKRLLDHLVRERRLGMALPHVLIPK